MSNNQIGNTQRIKAIDPGMAKRKAKELLDAVEKKYGGAPNSFKTMANSPAAFRGAWPFWLTAFGRPIGPPGRLSDRAVQADQSGEIRDSCL